MTVGSVGDNSSLVGELKTSAAVVFRKLLFDRTAASAQQVALLSIFVNQRPQHSYCSKVKAPGRPRPRFDLVGWVCEHYYGHIRDLSRHRAGVGSFPRISISFPSTSKTRNDVTGVPSGMRVLTWAPRSFRSLNVRSGSATENTICRHEGCDAAEAGTGCAGSWTCTRATPKPGMVISAN